MALIPALVPLNPHLLALPCVDLGRPAMAISFQLPCGEERASRRSFVWVNSTSPFLTLCCQMIGEAIDALGEDGGSAEDSISTFIRANHPGVPSAHDRFLRHYLAKHVAEGFFVCTAPGRYARSTDEAAAVEAARVEPPVVQVKRGRGRPRKDGSSSTSPAVKKDGRARSAAPERSGRPRKDVSSSTSPAVKKDGNAPSVMPTRRGRPRRVAPLAAGDDYVPAASVAAASAVAGRNESQATASEPRRRRGLRKLATITNVSGEARVTEQEDDSVDGAPSTMGKEEGRSLGLALVVVGNASATAPTADNKVCNEGPPIMPVDRDQPDELALVTTTDVPAPMPLMDKHEERDLNLALVVKQDGISSTVPEPSNQASELALVATDDDPVSLRVPSAEYRRLSPPRKALPMVIVPQNPAPTSAAGNKAPGKTLSVTTKPKGHRRQRRLALVAAGAHPAPASVIGKKSGNEGSVATIKINLTPETAGHGNAAPSVAPKPHGQPGRLYPLTADEIPDDPSRCLLALPAATQV
jgi:hypothetical protein